MDGLRNPLHRFGRFPAAHLLRARVGRQKHRSGQSSNADRLAIGAAIGQGEGEAPGYDGAPSPHQGGRLEGWQGAH